MEKEGLSAEEIDRSKIAQILQNPMKVMEKQIEALQKAMNYVLVDQEEASR
ncbi:hypothetical protein P7H15_26660 [Paenibacillus larvae]|nr:hypothetical protein [Paenibacillus larvae]MDT2295697.1 hypothetical protein [Paenibacillus larvae]